MKRKLFVMIMSIAVGAELLAATNDGDNQKKNEIISSDRDAAIVDASTSILKFFSLGGDSAKVTGYKSGQSPTAIDIPSRVKIDGKVYNVTSIGNGAFYGCNNLDVVIDNKKKNIRVGKYTFDGCKSVKYLK